MGVHAFQGGQGFAGEAHFAIGRVLEHHAIVLVGQFDQPPAAWQAEAQARGILEIRNGVDEFDVWFGLQHVLQLIHVHAIFIHGHTAIARFASVEGDGSAKKSRAFGDDHIAGIDQQLGHQIKPLLAALQHQYIIGRAGHALNVETAGYLFTQFLRAVGHGILQRDLPLFRDGLAIDFGKFVTRKKRGIGIATGK